MRQLVAGDLAARVAIRQADLGVGRADADELDLVQLIDVAGKLEGSAIQVMLLQKLPT